MTLHKHWKGIILFLLPVLVLYGMFFLYPLVFVYLVSFMKWNGVTNMAFVGLKNYITNFQDSIFLTALENNFIWALSLGFVQVGLAALVALILALIAIVAIVALIFLGGQISSTLSTVGNSI